MTTKEMIETLRYKAENIKAHIEPEFFNVVAECMEEYKCYKNNNDFSEYADKLYKVAYNKAINKAIYNIVDKLDRECLGKPVPEEFEIGIKRAIQICLMEKRKVD